jgi:uncharacterized membrane protein YdjX (TVP38/TMEM64 family)
LTQTGSPGPAAGTSARPAEADRPRAARFARLRHLIPLGLLLVGLGALWESGLLRDLSWAGLARHEAALQALVAERPVLAAAAYVGFYAVVVALSVPEAAIVTVAGGLLFGTWLGGALAIIGATIGALLLFLAARYALADLLSARAAPPMTTLHAGLARDGLFYLLAIRLVPIFPFWLVNLGAAAAGMRVLPFLAATLIGIIPGTLVFAGLGAGLPAVLARGEAPDLAAIFMPRMLLPLLGLAALSLLPVVWRWRMRGNARL